MNTLLLACMHRNSNVDRWMCTKCTRRLPHKPEMSKKQRLVRETLNGLLSNGMANKEYIKAVQWLLSEVDKRSCTGRMPINYKFEQFAFALGECKVIDYSHNSTDLCTLSTPSLISRVFTRCVSNGYQSIDKIRS